jgi:hypothetical protein
METKILLSMVFSFGILFLFFFIKLLTIAKKCVIYIQCTTNVLRKTYGLFSGIDLEGLMEEEKLEEKPNVHDENWE